MNKQEQDTVQLLQELGTFEKYRCIYADPPWSKNQKGKLGAISHYDLMTLEQIQRMPIRALSHEDAMAWLWVPQGLIPEGLEVLKSWGYRYIDEMIWDKYYLGLGRYLRHTHETMLLGIRGKPELKFRAQPSLVRAPRQDHSHKPEEFFPIIERISHPPYLELFARRRPTSACPEQWDVWGNEIASDLYIPGYPVYGYHRTNLKQYDKAVWVCPSFYSFGKAVCPSQKIPEDILISKTKEVLEVDKVDRGLLEERIKEIFVPEHNHLTFILMDESEVDVFWEHPSRSLSWTSEMKQRARERALQRYHKEEQ